MKAILYRVGQKPEAVQPKNGKSFTLKELQAYVGGTIVQIPLPSGKILTANDNGKLIGLPFNEEASKMFREEYPIEKYPHNNDETLVGDVVVCGKRQAGW